jgi:hypothetical protein
MEKIVKCCTRYLIIYGERHDGKSFLMKMKIGKSEILCSVSPVSAPSVRTASARNAANLTKENCRIGKINEIVHEVSSKSQSSDEHSDDDWE